MATVTIPFTFVNNTQNADATQVNSNFSTLASFLNTEVIQRDASVAFTQIPTLPSTTPTLANHATRKGYVDSFFPVTSANIADGAIMDIDVNASANIARGKLNLTGTLVAADFAASAQPVVICTSGARPTTGLVEGLVIYETDTDRILSYTGAVWRVEIASGSYTPTVDNLTLGTGGTNSAVWAYSRGVLTIGGLITLGTGGAVSGNILISYPSGFQGDPVYETDHPIGSAFFGGGGSNFAGSMTYSSAARMKPIVHKYDPTGVNANSYVSISGTGSAIPFSSWASGYDVRWNATLVGTLT
jgi:hypothetical protein